MKKSLAILAIALGAVSMPAHAQSEAGRFEITPYAAYSFGGRLTDLDGTTEVQAVDSEN